MSIRTVTRTRESEAPPEAVYLILADALQISRWAPAFAEKVEHLGDTRFRVTKLHEEFAIDVLTNAQTLTVDYLRSLPGGKRGGAYIRVLPIASGGSVVVMTVPVAPDATVDAVAAGIEGELALLSALVSGHS